MRTTLALDNDLVESVISLTQVNDPSEAVSIALNDYIKMKNKEKQLTVRELRGVLKWEGDLDQMRGADDRTGS